MSSLPQLDDDLRAVFAVDVDDARFGRALERALRVVDDEIAATRMRTRRAPRRAGLPRMTPRALLIMLLVLVIVAAVAVAQPAVRRVLFGEPDKPANRVQEFQQPATRSFDVASFKRPSEDLLEHGLAISIASAAEQRIDDPAGWGTPLDDYARVLLDREVDGVRIRIAAAPTDRGYLCYATSFDSVATGSCIDRLDDQHPARFGSTGTPGTTGSTVIAGVLIDGVRSVTVRFADGRVERAVLESNAFAWAGTGLAPSAVEIELGDGTIARFGPSGAPR